jgi:ribosomal protein S14
MKVLQIKDKNRRILYYHFEKTKNILKSIIQNFELPKQVRYRAYQLLIQIPRDASITRLRNRCTLTNRPRAVYRKFKMSRLMFRKYALQGELIGVRKSS